MQRGWSYLDHQGRHHKIGLYHGDSSGHLMIYCDLKVVKIDFGVKAPKTYSFFIEDELCEMQIKQDRTGAFSYDFVVNEKVDTPLNRERWQIARQDRRKFWLVAIILSVLGLIGGAWWCHGQLQRKKAEFFLTPTLRPEQQQHLAAAGLTASARFFIVREGDQRRIWYTFDLADGRQFSGKTAAPDTGQVWLPTGFPLADRDVFHVRYLPATPAVHRIEFSQPDPATTERYAVLAAAAEQQAHPQWPADKIRCRIRLIAAEKGWPALATVLGQARPPERDERHNRDAYGRLVREPGLAAALEAKCQPF
jgi:Fas apoptotic inhibitory molecule (FAIM1)